MDQGVRFKVNGVDIELPAGFELSKNLNSVIKTETGFKVYWGSYVCVCDMADVETFALRA